MGRGKLIVIAAPSGTGKSTLITKLREDIPTLEFSVSCTTREMRKGEVNGKHYHFISVDEFLKLREENDFVEWAEVHSNFYGTRKSTLDEGLEKGTHLLFEIDVQGCDSLKKIYGDEAHVIFIEPPSVETLEERLRARATDSTDVINIRLNNAKKELTRKNDFDYNIVNDDIELAYKSLFNVVQKIIQGS